MNVLDLFSGIGGFSLGLERAGMRTVAFCEIDPYCRRVLARHWPDVPIFGDVRELTGEIIADAIGSQLRQQSGRWHGTRGSSPAQSGCDGAQGIVADADVSAGTGCGKPLGKQTGQRSEYSSSLSERSSIDVICGGFPCQDISVAGKGAGIGGERSGLWSEYARIIGELRPRYVIVENVAALLSRGLGDVLRDLAAVGYDAEWHCIRAADVGAPHRRDRVWIIAQPQHSDADADADRRRCEGERLTQHVEQQGTSGCEPDGFREAGRWQGQDVADASRNGMERNGTARQQEPSAPIGARLFGCDSTGSRTDHWLTEPNVGRVAHGVPNRVDRLRALGNAVVPQIPELIGRAIMQGEPR